MALPGHPARCTPRRAGILWTVSAVVQGLQPSVDAPQSVVSTGVSCLSTAACG